MAKPAVTASSIDHVVLHVRDVAASRAFYTGVLGMTVRSAGSGYAFLHCGDGGQQIGLFEAEDGEAAPGGDLNHLAFTAPGSAEAIRAALAEAGVAVRGRRGDPRCLYFEDPDGYTLQIVAAGDG